MHAISFRDVLPAIFAFFLLVSPFVALGQDFRQDRQDILKGKVTEVVSQEERLVPGTNVESTYQTITAEILEGSQKGKRVTIENDFLELSEGQVFYLMHTVNTLDGVEMYSVVDVYRFPALLFLVALFLLCVFIFGGKQGIRGIISLSASLFLIIYVLLPGIVKGYSPELVSLAISSVIIVIGSYVTHGVNKTTTAAVLGMIATVTFTGILALLSIKFTQLSGFSSEESVYLNINTGGSIDFAGLLLGGILIGLLGVLYDAAIGQAIAIEELHRAGPHLSRKYIYQRAIRIGREHIGALVNTLAIAYVGASLPLLLMVYTASSGTLVSILNQEIFATEIVRTMVGSIGLVLAVPITTLIATWVLVRRIPTDDTALVMSEKERAEHIGHAH